MGLNPLSLSNNNELVVSYPSLLYACLLVSVNFYVFYCVLIQRYNMIFPGESPVDVIVEFIGILCEFIELTSMWLICGFCQNRIKIFIKSFLKATTISRKLGILDAYEKDFIKLGIYLTSTNFIYLAWMKQSYDALIDQFSDYHISEWVCYTVFRLGSFNMLTLFIWILIIIKQRFKQLNEKTRILMQHNYENTNEVNIEESSELIDSR